MHKKAVTLIEILLVVILSALLMAAIIPFIRSVSSTWEVGSSKQEILQNGRAALEMMTRYIRQARRITQVPGSTQIKIRDLDDKFDITFYYDGGQKNLMMRSNQTGSDVDSLLAPGVDSLTFNFLQDNGTPATRANQVKSVHAQMVLSDPLGSTSYTLALEDTVVLRQDVKITSPVWFSHTNQVGELSSDIWVGGFSSNPNSVSVYPLDGSCWVADTGNDCVKKLSSAGTTILNLSGFKGPQSVSVNSSTGECWVADTANNRIKKLSPIGAVLVNKTITKSRSQAVSVYPPDGSCWVADTGNNKIKKLSADGKTILVDLSGFNEPQSVAVNPNEIINGKEICWVADTGNNRVKKISYTGTAWTVSVNLPGFNQPRSVSVNQNTTECWVADTGNNRIVKLSSSGSILWSSLAGIFSSPQSVSVNPTTGDCWVASTGNNKIVKLNSEGDIEFDIGRLNSPFSPLGVSARP